MNKRCRHRADKSAAAGAVLIQSPASDCWKLGTGGSDWRSGHCPSVQLQSMNAGFPGAGSPLFPLRERDS